MGWMKLSQFDDSPIDAAIPSIAAGWIIRGFLPPKWQWKNGMITHLNWGCRIFSDKASKNWIFMASGWWKNLKHYYFWLDGWLQSQSEWWYFYHITMAGRWNLHLQEFLRGNSMVQGRLCYPNFVGNLLASAHCNVMIFDELFTPPTGNPPKKVKMECWKNSWPHWKMMFLTIHPQDTYQYKLVGGLEHLDYFSIYWE